MSRPGGAVVRIFPDMSALSHGAAQAFAAYAQEAISTQGRFTAALSGGSTPKELYALLAEKPYRDLIDWKLTHLFWADERCVPPDHGESNFSIVREALLSRIAIPEKNIHRIKGEEDADRASLAYEEELKKFFGMSGYPEIDLILLGVGEDGHTASLFPGALQLAEQHRWAVPVYPGRGKRDRVTLTLPILNHGKHVLFLAAGPSKREIIRTILHEGNPVGLPAGLIQPVRGSVMWYLDKDAASQ